MDKKIIVDVDHHRVRVAVLEDGDLVELYFEDDENQRLVGNIYRGKVANVLPGMQAAFVDIGLCKNAFLYIGDICTDKSVFEFEGVDEDIINVGQTPSIQDVIKEGQEITVQVLKEPIGTKGARVTTHITLPGRYLVLMPTVNRIGVSRRIEDEEERQRLKAIIEEIKPENLGLIVRTAALGKKREDFLPDLDYLLRLWQKIKEGELKGRVPRLIHTDECLLYRTIRDLYTSDVSKFIINNLEEYQKALGFAELISPLLKTRIEYYRQPHDIFEYYGIESKIEKAIQRKVWLKNGGYIVIEQTEALTVVDVNTGKYVGKENLEQTALNTNLEAARETAHQIRLRDIGGIIIIDFIDMEKESNRQQVLDALREALKRDRTKTSLIGITGLGLVELTRKKVRPRLSAKLLKPCPYCNGTGRVYSEFTVLTKVEKELDRLFKFSHSQGALVEVHPSVARLWLEDEGKGLNILKKNLGQEIYIKPNSSFHVQDVSITPLKTGVDREEKFDAEMEIGLWDKDL